MLPGSRQGHCWPLLPYVYCLPRQKQSIVHPGSSPRLRGTDSHTHSLSGFLRFIPAPAGNGNTGKTSLVNGSVHPRACGERCHAVQGVKTWTGSSPRLRGTADRLAPCHTLRRFIPAPAGNGGMRIASSVYRTVHPRACGERDIEQIAGALRDGSSPRLRGTVGQLKLFDPPIRFIPAPAGNGRRLSAE